MPTESYTSRLSLSTTATFVTGLEFLSESIGKGRQPRNNAGMRGSRSIRANRTRYSENAVGGRITMEPNPEEWAILLPWILGANASGTTYALAEVLQTRYIAKEIDTGLPWFRYAGCLVNRATISSATGSNLRLDLDVIGVSEAQQTAGTFAAVTYNDTPPFTHYDSSGAFTVDGSPYAISSFQLVIDNMITPRFYNSLSATLRARDRRISMSCLPELADSTALAALNDLAVEIPVVQTFAFNGYSLSFAMNHFMPTTQTPVIPNRDEVPMPFGGLAMRSTDMELIVTLDSTA